MFDIQAAITAGLDNPAVCFLKLSGVSLQLALDALNTYIDPNTWYPTVSPEELDAVRAALDEAYNELMTTAETTPVGTINAYAGDTTNLPTGWLHCNGDSLSTTTYPDLFAIVGYKFGGSGSTFNLPDTRTKFIRGGSTTGGATGGSNTATLSSIHIPPHTHNYVGYTATAAFVGAGSYTRYPPTTSGTTTATSSYGGSGGVAQPFAIVPPYVDAIYIIKAENV